MPATRTARRPAAPVAGQFELMLGLPAATDGQLDIVAAVADALEAPRAAVRMAAELSASTGLALRALPDGSITNAPAPPTVNAAAVYDVNADRHCHGRTKAKRRCSDRVVPEWKGSLVLSDGSHWCRQHAHQGWALTR